MSEKTRTREVDHAAGEPYRTLALRVFETREAERARLARFLHDDVAQFLSGIGLQLDILRMDFEGRVPEIGGRTGEIQQILESLVGRVRDLSYDLNPEIVGRAGLHSAMDRLVGRYRRLFSGTIRLLCPVNVQVPRPAAECFHRIAELAVDNAVRHGQGQRIEVIFRISRGCPTLEIRDNGGGFDVAEARENPPGLGMVAMQHYADNGGLRLSVRSSPGRGATVKAFLAAESIP